MILVPVSPNSRMILLIAILLGIGIPFGIVFLGRMLDNTVNNKKDLSVLSIPFLSEIPQLKSTLKRNLMNVGRHRFDNQNCRIMVRKSSRDVINEAFRVLRTNLDMMIGKTNGCETIMITSFNPNAGKTFISMNIAASMALKGQKVLMVDLDLRKATLSKSLGMNHEGVVSYLIAKHDRLNPLIQNVDENLDLLSVGTLPPNPAELLLSERFTEMLQELKSEYKYIFLDCPPVDIVADTSIIAQSADLSIFVMRSGIMDKRALPSVETIYQEKKYKHMAVVLNGVSGRSGGYGKYGYGHYGYGYGSYGYGYGTYGSEEKDEQ